MGEQSQVLTASESAAVKQVPMIGYSIVANFPDQSTQMTAQCFVPENETDEEVSRRISRVMRVVDRQRAFYDRVTVRKEVVDLREKLSQCEEDIGRAEVDHRRQLASLDVQLSELEERRVSTATAGKIAWEANGRRGDYKPVGPIKAQLDNFEQVAKQVAAERDRLEADKAQHLEQIEVSKRRFAQAIASREQRIAELDALIGDNAGDDALASAVGDG